MQRLLVAALVLLARDLVTRVLAARVLAARVLAARVLAARVLAARVLVARVLVARVLVAHVLAARVLLVGVGLVLVWLPLAAPGVAQSVLVGQGAVDPAAVLNYEPDGASGVALTAARVRAYLAKPIPEPRKDQRQAASRQMSEAKAARTKMLSDPAIYAPRWTNNAFELHDGSMRAMSDADLEVVRALEEADAAQETLLAMRNLSIASDEERQAYADVTAGLLEAGVRNIKEYVKAGASWRQLSVQLVGGQPRIVEQPVAAGTEVLLQRFALARGNLGKTWRDATNRLSTARLPLRPVRETPF